jgi:hypothetical protein
LRDEGQADAQAKNDEPGYAKRFTSLRGALLVKGDVPKNTAWSAFVPEEALFFQRSQKRFHFRLRI